MGLLVQGPWGMIKNKTGQLVGRIKQGQNVITAYQPNVHNPNTEDQQKTRSKFSLMTAFGSQINGFLRTSFASLDGYRHGNPFSSFVGYNLRKGVAVTGTWPNYAIDYSYLEVGVGGIDLPYSPSATADGITLSLTWADNAGMGDAETTDYAMVLVYNPAKNQCVYNTQLATRNERNATFQLPTAWTGDTVNVWMVMRRPKTGECSNSKYLASLPL